MAVGGLGAVEVQKDSRSRMWYCGFVRDVCSTSELLIAFEEDIWPAARYPIGGVRKAPRSSPADLDKFSPKIGEEVEMRIDATPHAPACWAVGTVGKIKHDFYVVSINPAAGQKGNDQIVEKEKLRPVAVAHALTADSLCQENFKLPDSLGSWMSTEDGVGCFSHIQDQAGLVAILSQSSKMQLKLVGDKKATQRAKLLLEVHIKHQAQIQNFQDVREKRLKALESKRNRIEGSGFKHSCEFQVDGSFIPRIIGKGGETIRAVQEKFDATVRILDADSQSGPRTVRIFANNATNLAKARQEVEYVEEAMSLESDTFSWVMGKGGRTLQNFKEAAGLVYTRLEQDRGQLLLCGTRSAVQDAQALFDTHLMYFPVFRQMDEEMESIFEELESYGDWDARWEWNNPQDEDWSRGRGKGGKGWRNSEGAYYNGDARPSKPPAREEPAERQQGNRWDQRRKGERDKGGEETFGKEEIGAGLRLPKAKAGESESSAKGKGKKAREVVMSPDDDDNGDEAAEPAKGGRARRVRQDDADAVNGRPTRRGKMGVRSS
mmetsp:Transcript_48642/g.113559  ORF Transcript_48642/g.113559 Transcript_48642/m.113559 type:complete len:548 (-) Transcript_48642:68-1711(-)